MATQLSSTDCRFADPARNLQPLPRHSQRYTDCRRSACKACLSITEIAPRIKLDFPYRPTHV
jgi:hypothetical protein